MTPQQRDDLMGECPVEPTDETVCDACAAYMISQQIEDQETRPVDDKYIVFKREEFFRAVLEDTLPLEQFALKDAVVIRRRDHFAGPALHTYAACIAMVATVKPELQRIADYFHEQALEADATDGKFPD